MNAQQFVDLCRSAHLRAVRDVDGTLHVVGRRGDIFVHGPGRLAWCLFGPSATAKTKNAIKRHHVPGLLTVHQEGDGEAIFTFAPEHLARVARMARCSVRRVLSPEHRAALAAGGASTRFGAAR